MSSPLLLVNPFYVSEYVVWRITEQSRIMVEMRAAIAVKTRESATPPVNQGLVKASPNAEQLPVSSEVGVVSWEQPKFGLSNGLSSSRPSNPAVKQAHGEAEPVQREDGRQLTGARKTSPAWATGQRSLISEGPARGKERI